MNPFMNPCRTILAATLVALPFLAGVTKAAEPAPPLFLDPNYLAEKPDLSGLRRLRFLTTLDYPPFNFSDANKKPTGFNVDLARALCDALSITAKCEVQALPWEELDEALEAGRGEAIIAGTAVTADARASYGLTESYFRLPARFAAKADKVPVTTDTFHVGRKVGVVRGSAHAAMLAEDFPEAEAVEFADMEAAYNALRQTDDVDFIFGDGVSMSFWLLSQASGACCAFAGGPYLAPRFLGHGMAIAVRRDDRVLLRSLNHALAIVQNRGDTAKIYARYFPLDPYGLAD